MIFDSLKNKENYKEMKLIYEALCYLDTLAPGQMIEPGIKLADGKIAFKPVRMTTKPEDECAYEAHRRFIDIHYIVSGVERIGTADPSLLEVTSEYSDAKDVYFVKGGCDGYYNIKPGQFMVCFPEDAHKVSIMADSPCAVEKIVVKVEV